MKIHNFSAGPCILPQEVFKKASEAVIDFNGLSILEISHRSPDFEKVMQKSMQLVKDILNIPNGYSVLFLQGGASLEFLMVPFNLMKENGTAGYLETGVWAKKAIAEAKNLGNVNIVASSKDTNFNYIPKGYEIPKGLDYFHCTSNNTIYGTQIKDFPLIDDTLIVCDMSSDIFSREIDVSKFDLIYAGAQKNMGPAGVTLVIIKDEILGKTGKKIPTMLDYKIHIDNNSMFNTCPVFSIYVSMLNLEWLKNNGGIEWIEKINEQKAKIMYEEIDRNTMFDGTAKKEDRSTMNATFILKDENKKDEFDKMWKEANISGIRGHKSVGGYRASMYNAMPIDSVKALTNVMKNFEKKFA